jgi:hypothetical protein
MASRWTVACAIAAHAAAAAAESRSPALDRASAWVGAAYGYPTVQAGTDAYGGSFQTRAFDLSDEQTLLPRMRFDLVLGARHGVSFDYYELRSGRSKVASQPFRFLGTEYTAEASVSGRVDADVATAAYRLWLGSGNTVLGLGAGAAFYRLDLEVVGRASLNGQAIEARAGYASDEVAPLLTAGLRHALTERVRLYADASGIRRTGGRLNGHIYNTAVGVEWFPWRSVGFAAEYGAKRLRLERAGSSVDSWFDLRLDKPTLFLRARF